MELNELINPSRVLSGLKGQSKKRILEKASEFISQESGFATEKVYHGLIERERLGSTGIGYGVAIPHCRINGLSSEDARGYLIQLAEKIDFDSLDKGPVDLLFILLVPQHTSQLHLDLLSDLASCFKQNRFRSLVKLATSSSDLYSLAQKTFASVGR